MYVNNPGHGISPPWHCLQDFPQVTLQHLFHSAPSPLGGDLFMNCTSWYLFLIWKGMICNEPGVLLHTRTGKSRRQHPGSILGGREGQFFLEANMTSQPMRGSGWPSECHCLFDFLPSLQAPLGSSIFQPLQAPLWAVLLALLSYIPLKILSGMTVNMEQEADPVLLWGWAERAECLCLGSTLPQNEKLSSSCFGLLSLSFEKPMAQSYKVRFPKAKPLQ